MLQCRPVIPVCRHPTLLVRYVQTQAVIENLSSDASKESLNTLVTEIMNLVGNSAVEAFAKHVRFSSTSTQRLWKVDEVDPHDPLSLIPDIALDCIFMHLPPKDRMRLGLVSRTFFTHVQQDRCWKEEGSLAAVQHLWELIQKSDENLGKMRLGSTQILGKESRSNYPHFVPTPTLLFEVERLKTMLYIACPKSLLPLFGKVNKAFLAARMFRTDPEDFYPLLERVAENPSDQGKSYEIQDYKETIEVILSCYGISRKAVPVFCVTLTKLFLSTRLKESTAVKIMYCIEKDFPDLKLADMVPTEFFNWMHMNPIQVVFHGN